MRKALTIGLAVAVMTATPSLHAVGDAEHAAAANDSAGQSSFYQRGPRIIHVPQPGERHERASERDDNIRSHIRASVNSRDASDLSTDTDDHDNVPPPRPREVTSKPRNDAARVRKPRWGPPPQAPRRTVLSAPPPMAEGPTPIRPTPRFETRTDRTGKFTAPPDSELSPSTPAQDPASPARHN